MTFSIDKPDSACAFGNRACNLEMSAHGGFDVHHVWPKAMGGAEHQTDELALCPNHHARQHALIRYMVENLTDMDWDVMRKFKPAERKAAKAAVDQWKAAGRPAPQWSRPAAR